MWWKDMELIGKIAFWVVIAGAINLGLIGLLHIDVISTILGYWLGRLVFVIIGVAAGFLIYLKFFNKKV